MAGCTPDAADAAERSDPGGGATRVRVVAFARARELLGSDAIELSLPPGSRVSDCLATLLREHPRLEPMASTLLVAVNEEYATSTRPLRAGDTVALIPPVSGG